MYFEAVSQMDSQTHMRRTVSFWPIFFIHWGGNEHVSGEQWILNCVNTGGGRSQEDHPTVTALCGRGDLPINCGCVCVYTQLLSSVWPFPTPWTTAAAFILSMGFPGLESWSGCHLLLQGMSDPFRPHGPWPPCASCPWDFPGGNTRVGAISSSRGSSRPRDQTWVPCIGSWVLHHWATWEALISWEWSPWGSIASWLPLGLSWGMRRVCLTA